MSMKTTDQSEASNLNKDECGVSGCAKPAYHILGMVIHDDGIIAHDWEPRLLFKSRWWKFWEPDERPNPRWYR